MDTRAYGFTFIADSVIFVHSTFLQEGFWKMTHEARTDYAMLLGSLFLLIVGAGPWSNKQVRRRIIYCPEEDSYASGYDTQTVSHMTPPRGLSGALCGVGSVSVHQRNCPGQFVRIVSESPAEIARTGWVKLHTTVRGTMC